jgi:hypothetical protein
MLGPKYLDRMNEMKMFPCFLHTRKIGKCEKCEKVKIIAPLLYLLSLATRALGAKTIRGGGAFSNIFISK